MKLSKCFYIVQNRKIYKYFTFYIFFRLKTSGEEITEILLSKGKVISALLYANNQGMERQIPARKFLQVNVVTCLCGLTENLFSSGNGNNFLSLFFRWQKILEIQKCFLIQEIG